MQEKYILNNSLVITPLLKAQKQFNEALKKNTDDLTRDGCIQRFEYCFELSWKTLKRILNYRGIIVSSPRETFRLSAKENLIRDPEIWFKFLKDRNDTVHTYNEDIAIEIYADLESFKQELSVLISTIEKL